MTNAQLAAIELLLREQAAGAATTSMILPVGQTYGQILLVNGQTLLGNWTYHREANVCDFTDDKGVRWWIDVDKVICFSLAPPPAPA